jgi:hypothetical protein
LPSCHIVISTGNIALGPFNFYDLGTRIRQSTGGKGGSNRLFNGDNL